MTLAEGERESYSYSDDIESARLDKLGVSDPNYKPFLNSKNRRFFHQKTKTVLSIFDAGARK
ncbi:MAG: hypothetical protein CM15mP62_30250 [Rhodospirillaceae bacterium]|nr:MAG: hypothetical protein CM15mP62_30250 [Rhodospirillaceae bacterium]